MSTTLDEERREFEELCNNNPNYPKDFELHKMYQSHIKKWKPLIESNDPSIYSDWKGFVPVTNESLWSWDIDRSVGDDDRMMSVRGCGQLLVDRESFEPFEDVRQKYSGHTWNCLPRYDKVTMFDKDVRRDIILVYIVCYIWRVEKQPELERWDKDVEVEYSKRRVIEMFHRIDRFGRNPFDYGYYYYTRHHYGDSDQFVTNYMTIFFFVLVVMLVFIGLVLQS